MHLRDIRVAVLVSEGFEQSHFDASLEELRRGGAMVEVLAPTREQMLEGIEATSGIHPIEKVMPDALVHDADPKYYHALLIPGGALSVDALRTGSYPIAFVQNMVESGKPVGAICHGAWLLADAGVAFGRTLTCWPAIKRDLERAGAICKEGPVLEDGNLVTCCSNDDLPAFAQAFAALIERTYRQARGARANVA